MLTFIIILAIGSLIIYSFNYNKDNSDLESQSLHEKFKILTSILNEYAFDNEGHVYSVNKRAFNLGAKGHNQLIQFEYAAGTLIITWKYKFYQKEVVNTERFQDCRNLSIFEQEKIAKQAIYSMNNVVEKHKSEVLSDASF